MKFYSPALFPGLCAAFLGSACVFSTDDHLHKDELIGRWQSETWGPHGTYFEEYDFINNDSAAFTYSAVGIGLLTDSNSIPVAFRYFSKTDYGSWEVAGDSLYLKRGTQTGGYQDALDTLRREPQNLHATYKIKGHAGAIEISEWDGSSRIYFKRE